LKGIVNSVKNNKALSLFWVIDFINISKDAIIALIG